MPTTHSHAERHANTRIGWLRAAVLGANDGIVSTASLVLGVAAATDERGVVFTAGLAALVAGALSMAVGEYVSVSSQRDAEDADIARERHELETVPETELDELIGIYEAKGLSHDLAEEVARELSRGDVLQVHLAEELGITETNRPRPLQAASSSATAFALGASLPLFAVLASPDALRLGLTFVSALLALVLLGTAAARLGRAPVLRAVTRTFLGGAAAMALTMGIGALFGTAID